MIALRFLFRGFSVLLVFFVLAGLAPELTASTVSDPMPLWPNGAPDEKGTVGQERDMTDAHGRMVSGRRVARIANVSVPTITVYRPSRFKANGAAVIVCPGGGYSILAVDLEGTEVCQWLNSIGVTAVLLKYRVPKRTNDETHLLPLEDAQRAMGLVRYNSKAWKIDPNRVGILGFSAGGHLVAHLDGDFDKRAYTAADEADQASCRPDFGMLIYPGALVPKGTNSLAPEIKVTARTPPTFMAKTEDDPIKVESCIYYYLALKDAKVPAEMHLYPSGGHGYGLRPSQDLVSTWPKRAEDWLRSLGVLKSPGHHLHAD